MGKVSLKAGLSRLWGLLTSGLVISTTEKKFASTTVGPMAFAAISFLATIP